MDASQYTDQVLVMLFVKYISDKYAGELFSLSIIPPGSNFEDMVAMKDARDIGEQIKKKLIGPPETANKLSGMPDFSGAPRLGTGKEMVDRLANLIAIFENPALNFSSDRAEEDDILGDARVVPA